MDKVLVEVDIDITRILLIDEVNGIFETQQFVNLSWKDPRIQFHNLKLEDYQNSLLESEKGMIWVPTVTFLNTARQERSQRDNTSLVTVHRGSGYTISDDTEANNVYIYQVGNWIYIEKRNSKEDSFFQKGYKCHLSQFFGELRVILQFFLCPGLDIKKQLSGKGKYAENLSGLFHRVAL